MKPASIDIAAELVRLEAMTNFELRVEWRLLHRTQPPKSVSRDLLLRGITYQLQVKALGGLSNSLSRKLFTSDGREPSTDYRQRSPRTAVKPGTRLVREWNGETHTVLVHVDGVEWRGQRYRSLSVVARAITGARWSGPRFFGLTPKTGASDG